MTESESSARRLPASRLRSPVSVHRPTVHRVVARPNRSVRLVACCGYALRASEGRSLNPQLLTLTCMILAKDKYRVCRSKQRCSPR